MGAGLIFANLHPSSPARGSNICRHVLSAAISSSTSDFTELARRKWMTSQDMEQEASAATR